MSDDVPADDAPSADGTHLRAYRVAYDGRPFHGFQRQPSVRTVEGELFAALRGLGVIEDEGEGATHDPPPGYAAAGRTDAGVSALAQTVAFEAPDWCSPTALNARLPDEIRAWAVADAPPDFHATRDAAWREYVYHLHAPDADRDRARAVLDRFDGPVDVAALTPDDEGTVCRFREATVERDGPYLVLTVRADGFRRQLVRRLVALVEVVATGVADPALADRHLDGEPYPDPIPDHERVGPAPPEPLYLADVGYPDLAFAVGEEAAERVRAVFDRRRVEHWTAARVARDVRDGIGD